MPAGMPYARGKGKNKNTKVGKRALRDYEDQPEKDELATKNALKENSKKSRALKKKTVGNPGRAMVHSFYGGSERKSTNIEDRRKEPNPIEVAAQKILDDYKKEKAKHKKSDSMRPKPRKDK